LGLLALDIDHFKWVNDTYGHDGGDHVLCSFSRAVLGVLRKGDSLYRTGGEEFVVILPLANVAGVLQAGERIVAAVSSSTVRVGEHVVSITTSAGAACLEGGEDGARLLSRADGALYEAKEGGRNRVCVSAGSKAPAERKSRRS
jgi:diguanylate cyclase (GGDEF)-like protein